MSLVGVGTWQSGHSPLELSTLGVLPGPAGGSERWVSSAAPQSRGARGSKRPDGGFVCLGGPAWRAYHIFLGAWESGLSSS